MKTKTKNEITSAEEIDIFLYELEHYGITNTRGAGMLLAAGLSKDGIMVEPAARILDACANVVSDVARKMEFRRLLEKRWLSKAEARAISAKQLTGNQYFPSRSGEDLLSILPTRDMKLALLEDLAWVVRLGEKRLSAARLILFVKRRGEVAAWEAEEGLSLSGIGSVKKRLEALCTRGVLKKEGGAYSLAGEEVPA